MIFWFDTKVFKDRIGPEALHVILRVSAGAFLAQKSRDIPNSQLVHAVPDNVCHSLRGSVQGRTSSNISFIPGPLAAANASSPMKKSRSSVPLFADKAPPEPVPPVRNEGLFAMAGLPDPEPPVPPGPPFVAIAVGKTKEGESLPAKPCRNQYRA